MKKIFIEFLISTLYLVPCTCFSQANTYFHDRIDTTLFAIADTVGHGANHYYATNLTPDFNVKQYVNGCTINLFFKKGNTGSATLTLVTKTATLSSKTIRKANGQVLISGDIPDSTAVILDYYNGSFRIAGIGVTASSSSWLLTGNVGTTAGTNFLGTTDAQDVVFKRNSTELGRFSSSGLNLGLASTNNGALIFKNSTNANTLTINSGITSASHSWTLPTAQGAASTFLQNDGSGILSWNNGLGSFWGLTGNSGTTAGTNFLGTTDAQDVVFKRNSSEVMRLYSSSNFVGIGTASPDVRLHVIGSYASQLLLTAKFQGDLPGLTFIDTRASALCRNWNLISGLNAAGALEFDASSSNGPAAVPNVHIASMFPSGNVAIGQGTDIGNRLAVISGSHGLSIAGAFPNQLAPQYGLFCEGNAGIGTGATTPAARIHAMGAGATSGTWTAQFHNSTGTSNSLMVRDDGNIGIGTASPSAQLHVANSTSTQPTFKCVGSNTVTIDYNGIGDIVYPHAQYNNTVTITYGSTTEAKAILFPNRTDSLGFYVVGDSLFYARYSGVYQILVTTNAGMSAASGGNIDTWININGSIVANSGHSVTVNSSLKISYVNQHNVRLNAGDYFKISTHADDTRCQLVYTAAGVTPTRPASPSAELSVFKISKL